MYVLLEWKFVTVASFSSWIFMFEWRWDERQVFFSQHKGFLHVLEGKGKSFLPNFFIFPISLYHNRSSNRAVEGRNRRII